MRISVVIATYNGEKYIEEQLLSIMNQSRQPDEVLIRDDLSTDDTVNKIKKFIIHHDLKNWEVKKNKYNKGWRKNFIDLARAANGELIFFSDQDDIWYRNKIQNMSQIIESNKNIQVLSGMADIVDAEGTLRHKNSKKQSVNTGGTVKKNEFTKKFIHTNALGCTMCVKKNFANTVYSMNNYNLGHDEQLFRMGIIMDSTYTVNIPVIKHRVHDSNATMSGQSMLYKVKNSGRAKNIRENIYWLNNIKKTLIDEDVLDKKRLKILNNTIKFLSKRLKFIESKNFIHMISLVKYSKYYLSLKMLLGDVYVTYFVRLK
ncbi:glycosyltransferase [Virgibacillus doumboii]|uniref:glycosyltransferase n=1 Tax=Virgibacillus doumboii TaxID=2697503 RepID=UPI0013DFDABB|nr:glycosyltransferase [Virgibacillus doumboii]